MELEVWKYKSNVNYLDEPNSLIPTNHKCSIRLDLCSTKVDIFSNAGRYFLVAHFKYLVHYYSMLMVFLRSVQSWWMSWGDITKWNQIDKSLFFVNFWSSRFPQLPGSIFNECHQDSVKYLKLLWVMFFWLAVRFVEFSNI